MFFQLLNFKNTIIIPEFISVFYCKALRLLVFKIKKQKRFLKVDNRLSLFLVSKKLVIFTNPSKNNLKFKTKKLDQIKKLFLFFCNKILLELTNKICKSVYLVGIGFKVFKTNKKNIIMLKVGYSHSVFFKLNVDFSIVKDNKIYITGNSFSIINKIIGKIRLLKLPDFYKGKGIQYQYERLILKTSKNL